MKTWNGMSYEQAHRLLWNTIADMEEEAEDGTGFYMIKDEAFKKINKNHEPLPTNTCFACAVAYEKGDICFSCPLYDRNNENYKCLNGLFELWSDAKGKEKAKYAREIANLPWK